MLMLEAPLTHQEEGVTIEERTCAEVDVCQRLILVLILKVFGGFFSQL
jgi:hypothetical protein